MTDKKNELDPAGLFIIKNWQIVQQMARAVERLDEYFVETATIAKHLLEKRLDSRVWKLKVLGKGDSWSTEIQAIPRSWIGHLNGDIPLALVTFPYFSTGDILGSETARDEDSLTPILLWSDMKRKAIRNDRVLGVLRKFLGGPAFGAYQLVPNEVFIEKGRILSRTIRIPKESTIDRSRVAQVIADAVADLANLLQPLATDPKPLIAALGG